MSRIYAPETFYAPEIEWLRRMADCHGQLNEVKASLSEWLAREGALPMRLPDVKVVTLNESEIALLILAGWPKPRRCSSIFPQHASECPCYARMTPGEDTSGALCRCCIRDSGMLYRKPYIYECDGRLNAELPKV